MLDVLELLVQAAYSRDKRSILARANQRLEVIRHLWRLAHELAAIPTRSYEHGAKRVDELGRQSITRCSRPSCAAVSRTRGCSHC